MITEPRIRTNHELRTKKQIVAEGVGFAQDLIRTLRLSYEPLQDVGIKVYIIQDGTCIWQVEGVDVQT